MTRFQARRRRWRALLSWDRPMGWRMRPSRAEEMEMEKETGKEWSAWNVWSSP
jgi:hypothetical protein